jgi:hypothetical protein
MSKQNIVNLRGKLSPLEEHFRQFDIGKAHWTTADYINYTTQKISPHFLKSALIEDFKQRYIEKNNIVLYIYGTQGSGKSLLGFCIGLTLGKIYTKPLKVQNIGFFDSQFLDIIKSTKNKEILIDDEEDDKNYGALSTYYSGEVKDAMFRNRRLQQNYIFCSPHEGERGQFITIDVKNTRKVNGKPTQIEALLYTSWYNDSEIRVCRGILIWDVPEEALDFYEKYVKYKDESLEKIKKDLGGNFDIVTKVAKEKYEELKNKLIYEEKGQYTIIKGAYFGDIIEVEGKIGKYTADIRKKIIRAIKVMAQTDVDKLNESE